MIGSKNDEIVLAIIALIASILALTAEIKKEKKSFWSIVITCIMLLGVLFFAIDDSISKNAESKKDKNEIIDTTRLQTKYIYVYMNGLKDTLSTKIDNQTVAVQRVEQNQIPLFSLKQKESALYKIRKILKKHKEYKILFGGWYQSYMPNTVEDFKVYLYTNKVQSMTECSWTSGDTKPIYGIDVDTMGNEINIKVGLAK